MKNLFKYASLLVMAAVLFSCSGTVDDPQGVVDGGKKTLVVSSDKNLIHNKGGDFAAITVTLGDEVITEGVVFMDGENNIIDIPDFKFSHETPGKYRIWASYGTYISEKITIHVTDREIPESPVDENPGSTDFVTRILLAEFTGTGCTNCPPMKELIRSVMYDSLEVDGVKQEVVDEIYSDRIVKIACHNYNTSDKAYFGDGDFKSFFNVTGWPHVNLDMYQTFKNYKESEAYLKGLIDQLYEAKLDMAAGIAVNSSFSEDGQIIFKATVKPAQTGSYRIGAMLLEDGIESTQSSWTYKWMNIHDGCVTYVDASYNVGSMRVYYGHSLGEIEKGKTSDWMFVWDLNEIKTKIEVGSRKDIVDENLRLVVFVTTIGKDKKGQEYYYVNNIVKAPLNGQVPFEYR